VELMAKEVGKKGGTAFTLKDFICLQANGGL